MIWDMNEDRVEYAFAKKFSPNAEPAAEVVTPETSQAGAFNEKKISQGKATEIALADAGFKQSEVTNLYAYYEIDDGPHLRLVGQDTYWGLSGAIIHHQGE